MSDDVVFDDKEVKEVMSLVTKVIKYYVAEDLDNAKTTLVLIPNFVYGTDFEKWIALIKLRIQKMDIPNYQGSKERLAEFVIKGLRKIKKIESESPSLPEYGPIVTSGAKIAVDHILSATFASFFVGRELDASEALDRLPIAWLVGDNFWVWKLYIDNWITEKTKYFEESLHTKFESFVYTRITRHLNRYLDPKDQRLRDLEHALEKIENIVKEVDVRIQQRRTVPSPAEEKQGKVTEKEQPRSDAARRLRKSRDTTKPESPIDHRTNPHFWG